APGRRPFEVIRARAGQEVGTDGFPLAKESGEPLEEARVDAITASLDLSLIEDPCFKRRWAITPKELAGQVLTFEDRWGEAVTNALTDALENLVQETCGVSTLTRSAIVERFSRPLGHLELARTIGADVERFVAK